MALDIFNAPKSVIASGLAGKVIMLYGKNNTGKTYQSTQFSKPYVMACEMGLNGIAGISYGVITRWSDFKSVVKQFTSPATKDKAREMYDTIIIDEVYASSLYCQDYVCQTFGSGALTLSDGDGKHNLYQLYEKEYFKQVNLLVSAGFTVVFIAHEKADNKTGFITPKGDKRCIDPIIDHCDYVIYLKGNGMDKDNNVVFSTAYTAATDEFFARSRFPETPTIVDPFTAENLEKAIQEGIDKSERKTGIKAVSFAEQQKQNAVEALDFDALMKEFQDIIKGLQKSSKNFGEEWGSKITDIVEDYLGRGGKVADMKPSQAEALVGIISDLKDASAKQ